METCSKNGIKRLGESCTLNNNCIYPDCKISLNEEQKGDLIKLRDEKIQ